MEQIIVTHKDGTTLKLQSKANVSRISRCTQTVELLGQDVVDISVESGKKLTFLLGDKITIIGRDYTLNTPATERKISESLFTYDLQFEGVQYDMLRAAYSVNVDTTSNEIQDINGDSLTGDLKRFLDVLISNLNRVFPAKWVLGTCPANTETKTLSFSDADNCLSVIQTLCSEDNFNTEFHIAIASNGVRTLNVGATGTTHSYTFEYGKGKGIYELTRQKVSSSNIVTRLNVFGSSKNIMTSKYRAFKLCLPTKSKSQSYIENAAAITKYGVWEGTKNFDDIFPHRKGTVTGIFTDPEIVVEGMELKFTDTAMDFDLNAKDGEGNTLYLIAGTSAKIHFNTGNLAGYEFEVASYDNATKEFTLLSQTDENGYTFPSATSGAFQFAEGDEYAITDIYMPASYITTAEAALQTAGQAYLDKYSQPLVSYGLTVDSFYLRDIVGAEVESNIIWAGDYIPIKDADLDVDKTIRVKGFTRDLLKDYSYSLTIADLAITVSTISRVITELKGIDNVIKFNNLKDPAKARRDYLSAQEVLNMIFDPEGDFYTEKIKPASIDTTMLSVGAKSMQFGMEGTILQPNYGGAKNRIVYVGGTLTHYTVLDGSGNPRTWNVTNGDITLGSDAAYYVYAKCAKSGSGASLLFSTSKITVEGVANYYHFLIGIVNSVDANNARAVALMYGFTTINGRFIRTGRVTSNDGTRYFDLDTGEFKGDFKFTNGTSVETAVGDAQTSANEAYGYADSAYSYADSAYGAASDAQSTANSAISLLNDIANDGKLTPNEKIQVKKEWLAMQEQFVVIDNQCIVLGLDDTDANDTYADFTNYYSYLDTYITPLLTNMSATSDIVSSTFNTKFTNCYAGFEAQKAQITSASKSQAISTAATDATNKVNAVQVGGSNLYDKTDALLKITTNGSVNKINDYEWLLVGANADPYVAFRIYNVITSNGWWTVSFDLRGSQGGSYQMIVDVCDNHAGQVYTTSDDLYKRVSFTINISNFTEAVYNFVDINCPSHVYYYIRNIKIEKGNKPTDYSVSDNDIKATITALDYLKAALTGSTEISGGLVGTNVILLKTLAGLITGGMSGLANDNIGMWTGGTYQNAIDSLAKIILRKDGSGQLAGGKILWDLLGALKVGNFDIINGNIIGRDADSVEKLKLSIEDIPTIASMSSTYAYLISGVTGSGWFTIESLWDSEIGEWYTQLTGGNMQKTTTMQITIPYATYINVESLGVTINIAAYGTGSSYNQTVRVKNLSGTTIATGSVNSNIQIASAGTYNIEVITNASVSIENGASTNVDYYVDGLSIKYIESVEKTALGKDGVFSYFSSSEYFHFKKLVGFSGRGKFDIPAGLGGGTVNSGGTTSGGWGKYTPTSSRSSTTVTITHNIGDSNYTILIMPTNSITFYLANKGSSTIQVIMSSSGGTFDYILMRTT